MDFLKLIYIAIENEGKPREKLSSEVILAIQGITSWFQNIGSMKFIEEIQPLYAECEEKLRLIS